MIHREQIHFPSLSLVFGVALLPDRVKHFGLAQRVANAITYSLLFALLCYSSLFFPCLSLSSSITRAGNPLAIQSTVDH